MTTGGSHGGLGGVRENSADGTVAAIAYGSLWDPNEAGGSGAAYFGNAATQPTYNPGGGIIRIAAQTVQIDGSVQANGKSNQYTGGAGGSIRIDATTLGGSGTINGNGANNTDASGGGGRIALYYPGTPGGARAHITAQARPNGKRKRARRAAASY